MKDYWNRCAIDKTVSLLEQLLEIVPVVLKSSLVEHENDNLLAISLLCAMQQIDWIHEELITDTFFASGTRHLSLMLHFYIILVMCKL